MTFFSKIKIVSISPNPAQPRKKFNEDDIQELAASIKNKIGCYKLGTSKILTVEDFVNYSIEYLNIKYRKVYIYIKCNCNVFAYSEISLY